MWHQMRSDFAANENNHCVMIFYLIANHGKIHRSRSNQSSILEAYHRPIIHKSQKNERRS